MQQEHFGKYSVLEQGKSWADRQVLTSLTAQSLSILLIPPDINSRFCFTFTSICRERRRLQKLSAISDFSLFLSKLSLSWPLLCVCRSPFTHFLTFSASVSLPLPYLPPHVVILFWGSAETSSSLLLCSPILFQVYIWSLYVNTARCKQAAPVGQLPSNTCCVLFNFSFFRSGSYLPGKMCNLSGWENIPLHLCGCSHLCWCRPDLFTWSV